MENLHNKFEKNYFQDIEKTWKKNVNRYVKKIKNVINLQEDVKRNY
jgi:hypothetical protein